MPARTAWSRNTEFSTRAGRRIEAEADIGETEDDLDLRELVPDRPIPSSVHCPSLRSSSLPVAMVKVSGSISRSDCGRP